VQKRAKKILNSEVKIKLKDSEAVIKGKEIARQLNLETQSCCPKLFRALNPDIPEVKHNKPLSHLIRPMQAILKSFCSTKESNTDKKKWGVGGKRAQSDLAD
jgi:hypothetical protein